MAYGAAKTAQAKGLRVRMTPAEKRLWSRLRANRFHDLPWLRQEPFGRYIVDFYCPVARVVVELDGDAHVFSSENDRIRQEWIQEQGATVVRFPNWAVFHALDQVLDEIHRLCLPHLGASSDSDSGA